MPDTALHPVNAELVAVAWLKGVAGLPVDNVATTLPGPNDAFARHGFVTATVISGVPNMDTPMQNSRVQIDCWAYNKDSQKVPWGKAMTLAAYVERATEGRGRRVQTPPQFEDAHVHSVIVLTEPRRVPDDQAYAHYSMDVRIHWTRRT